MYAVVDVETTGLFPGGHDRICEIAIVHVDGDGQLTDEWSSLINPGRDLGPQHVHGIRAADVRHAPAFAQLAGAIGERLRGRVVVAHNLAFDARFVAAEYARLGTDVPVRSDLGLCTMRLAGQFLPGAGRSLADCCHASGIANPQAHSALHDARATGQLFASFLATAGHQPPWQSLVDLAAAQSWPALAASPAIAVPRRIGEPAAEPPFLARLVDRLPRVPEPPQADSYLAVLDRALLDRQISAYEADTLVEVAESLGLGRSDVADLHRRYLAVLAAEAADDGVITDAERADLDLVAELLGLPATDVTAALTAAMAPAGSTRPGAHPVARFALAPGDVVVFTGQMDRPRPEFEQAARQAGLTVARTVTKKTRLLIAADPDSLSGKARQARRYGLPIVHPAAFESMIG